MDRETLRNRLLMTKFQTESTLTLLQKYHKGSDERMEQQINQLLDRLVKIN
jgi:hypothetical protein